MLKLFRYLKPYKVSIAIILLLLFCQSMAELYLPTLMADIVNIGIVNGDISYILRIGAYMLLVAVSGVVVSIIAGFLSAKTAVGFARDLRSNVFAQVEKYTLHEFDKIGTASLITRTTNDITQMQQVLIVILRMMISAPLMCIGGIIMAVSKDAKLSLVFVVVLPVLAATLFFIAGKGIPLFRAMQVKIDKLNLVLRENLTGVRVIRAFNRIEHERKRFCEANSDLTSTAIKVNIINASMVPIMLFLMNITSVVILWISGIRIDRGTMQVGDMIAFLQYAMQIMFSLVMTSWLFVMIPRAEVSAVRINEVLETSSNLRDPQNPVHPQGKKGLLEFDHVTFSYPGAEQPAISNITFCAWAGETTAIIGGTGSGKSTLVNLIPRFYDIDSGGIRVDGVDIRKITQESLRAKIGFVPQTAVLFSGTVADNIRYGKKDAAAEEIKYAAQIAQAVEFISAMKAGFDTEIAQGGANISGGQKQRLSIARALIRRPEIYIFDDSFSALDFKTDARLRAGLKKETSDSIVLIVAQRVSTVMDADRIIVLDEGQIAGQGTHQELLRTCKVYREIVSSQLAEEEIA
ncbi:MAG: ABC transporter ATP-binding protein [Thermincola sp.]|nr:ABC transporter ATP-binding protein [Thermincola sp.]MDT3702411.1 ABC transporter ATP-binding protein [Thermincola sp.]